MSKTLTGTISHGTLRLYDLASAFLDALAVVAPAAHQQVVFPCGFPCDGVRALEDSNDEYWDSEEAGDFVGMLQDTLSEHVPDGYYFGAHEGDGSDFGFWPLECEECDPTTIVRIAPLCR